MKEIVISNERARVNAVKKLITSVGNKIGAVSFHKRSDNSLRKMTYRLHVKAPTYATKPSGKKFRRKKDDHRNQLTVFDVNKIRYNKKDNMCGRGDYRTIPLENVCRVKANGVIYKISK